ncbi:MAG: peptidoglycan DD-metalloendopeptidase family protein [Chloroflexota bacterium]
MRSPLLIVLFTLVLGVFSLKILSSQAAAAPADQSATTVPTANLPPSRTPTFPPTNTLIPSATLTLSPSPTLAPLIFATNTLPVTPTAPVTNLPTQPPINSPTPGSGLDASGTPLPTWTPPPADPSTQISDHYWLRRPIGENGTNYLDRTYPYGGTAGGSLQVHHGVDFANGQGTPILAAGDGVVYYAGNDLSTVFGASTDYYGNLVVIQHNFSSPEGQPVYSLYGHMSAVSVQTGQTVATGDVIGMVGATGVAFGPHLHFEVRVGDPQSFSATRNPDLWISPYSNFGTLSGRVTDSAGNLLYNATVQVRATTSQNRRYGFTYPDTSVNGDSTFQENFTLGDLPANYYEVSVNDGQRVRYQQIIYVYPNHTTWINIVLN